MGRHAKMEPGRDLGGATWSGRSVFRPKRGETIAMRQAAIDTLVTQKEARAGRPASAEGPASRLDDKVLVIEAFGRDLHKTGYRARKQLQDVMRSGPTQGAPNPASGGGGGGRGRRLENEGTRVAKAGAGADTRKFVAAVRRGALPIARSSCEVTRHG
jgi:hypothetical protein